MQPITFSDPKLQACENMHAKLRTAKANFNEAVEGVSVDDLLDWLEAAGYKPVKHLSVTSDWVKSTSRLFRRDTKYACEVLVPKPMDEVGLCNYSESSFKIGMWDAVAQFLSNEFLLPTSEARDA